jgi:hypothetical protein
MAGDTPPLRIGLASVPYSRQPGSFFILVVPPQQGPSPSDEWPLPAG